jgi:RNA polymerase sigma factor (TIGR02999 family)
MPATSPNITQLLGAARNGNRDAADALYDEVYDELRRIAHGRLAKYRPGDTLDTSALVHEAYLKLVDQTLATYQDRAHFFATASRAMRFILIDYARTRMRAKRGGAEAAVPLDAIQVAAEERAGDLVALDEALDLLADRDERLARLVDYRFFGGMTYEEIATATDLSVRTVKRDWDRARTWLYRLMQTPS